MPGCANGQELFLLHLLFLTNDLQTWSLMFFLEPSVVWLKLKNDSVSLSPCDWIDANDWSSLKSSSSSLSLLIN